jgi:hypothetical protein
VQRACRQARAALVAQRLTLKERFRRQRPRLTTCPLVPVEERTPQPRRHEEYATCSRDATTSNEQSKKTTDRMHLQLGMVDCKAWTGETRDEMGDRALLFCIRAAMSSFVRSR